jgi:hypothetical protein
MFFLNIFCFLLIFPFFLVFKFSKDEVHFSISFIYYFQIFFEKI